MYDILTKFGTPKKLVTLTKACLHGTQSKVRIENYLSSSFLNEIVLKQGDAISPLLFNFALEHAIRNLNWDWMYGTHHVFAYADDLNVIGDDTIIKRYASPVIFPVGEEFSSNVWDMCQFSIVRNCKSSF